ncbi:MAG TPA: hypothetical protein PK040_06670 [Anaerolineaceae bacterium]|nr:hypothetical protein [Anaerolineaceae bacterium]
MRTPYGVECPYFYGDYYRGKHQEECRLFTSAIDAKWTPGLCEHCPVPAIKRANGCEHIQLTPVVTRRFGILKRQIKVKAFCTKSQSMVVSPEVGCGICHPLSENLKNIKIG